MSDMGVRSDMESIFLSPSLVLTNQETGKSFFEMKRKTPTRPDGTEECYYLFKFYDENMPDEDAKAKMHGVFEVVICPLAATMDIGMFSLDEVFERATERVKEILQSDEQLSEEEIDVNIEVFNYATKELGRLVVGISDKPVEQIEQMRRG